ALHGVIHSAGLAPQQKLLQASQQVFEEVLHPKIEGTLLLQELLAGKALDFVCHFSSAAAILGDFGVCSYAIGNRFQMGLARWAAGATRVLAINWPLWQDGGMSVGDEAESLQYLQWQSALQTAEGLACFERLL